MCIFYIGLFISEVENISPANNRNSGSIPRDMSNNNNLFSPKMFDQMSSMFKDLKPEEITQLLNNNDNTNTNSSKK